MASQPEGLIVKAILRRLSSVPRSMWWKTHGSALGSGMPDIIGCVDGRFVALEVKQPGRKATPLQELILRRIADAGGTSAVVTSVEEAVSVVESATR